MAGNRLNMALYFCILFAAYSMTIVAQTRNVATPYQESTSSIITTDGQRNTLSKVLSGGAGAELMSSTGDAASWLRSQQATNGGFPWIPGGVVTNNTQGATAQGLIRAYDLQMNTADYSAAKDNGDYLVPNYPGTYTNNNPRFAVHDPLFLELLSQMTNDAIYANFVQTHFWDRLANSQYGENSNMSATDFGATVVNGRNSQGYVALSPWDLSATAIAAHVAGEFTLRDALMSQILYGLEQTSTTDVSYDVIGLAGAIWAASVCGYNLNPTTGRYSTATSTSDLVAILLTYQQSSDGGFIYSSGANPTATDNGDLQTTAFAVKALHAFDPAAYKLEIAKGVAFMRSLQQTSGQMIIYPGASATADGSVESHAEALRALAVTAPHTVYVNATWTGSTYGADPDGTGPALAFMYDAFTTLEDALDAVQPGGSIYIASGTYEEDGQIVIAKDISIIGSGKATTIIKANHSTTGGAYSTTSAWFYVPENTSLTMSGVTLDGRDLNDNQQTLTHGIQSRGSVTITDCAFKYIKSSAYVGLAITLLSGSNTITNCDFEQIHRVGILVRGNAVTGLAHPTAAISGITYTGKGSGDWLDYAVEFGGGGSGSVSGSTISNNLGVATTDGSTSAGVQVTDYYGGPVSATISNSTISNCSSGIVVGYGTGDGSVVTVTQCDLSGSTAYGVNAASGLLNDVDARNNWWGDNNGPDHSSNSLTTTGVPVTDDVNFDPWTQSTTVTQTTTVTYAFDTDNNSNDDVTLTFSVLPTAGGEVFVSRSGAFPAGIPTPPAGANTDVYLEITSTLPNYQFNVTVRLDELPSGFGSNTMVYYYDYDVEKWVPISGTYFPAPPATAAYYEFTVNHFTPFVFVNTMSDPLVFTIPDAVVNDSFDETTLANNTTTYPWKQWMGHVDLSDDWTWEAQDFQVAVVPLEITSLSQTDLFAGSVQLKYDPLDWELLTTTGTKDGVTEGSLFTGLSTIFDVQTATAGSDNTVQADIAIQEAANPQVQVNNASSLSLATFAFRPLIGNPKPISMVDGEARTNLNEAYYVDLNDQGYYRMFLGDFVDATNAPTIDHSQGDGAVDLDDLTVWSLSYFSDVSGVSYPNSLGAYKLKYDIGPTSNNYIDGMPQPDGKVNFEDLVIFAISYGLDAANAYPKYTPQTLPVRVEIGDAIATGSSTLQPLLLRGEINDLRALSLQLALPPNVTLADVRTGALLTEEGVAMFKQDGNLVTLDVARLGESMTEEGLLCVLELSGKEGATLRSALARDSRNRPVDVSGGTAPVPEHVTLAQNYPNPFNPSTTISFSVNETMPVRLEVYSALGVHVTTLLDGSVDAGVHTLQWDGRDAAGRLLSSGMYVYRLTAGDTMLQRSMLLGK